MKFKKWWWTAIGTELTGPLVQAIGIKKYFTSRPSLLERRLGGAKTRTTKAVDGVDLEITRGETLGLVGESGCGKTTLGRIIAGLYAPTEGVVMFDGRRVNGVANGRGVGDSASNGTRNSPARGGADRAAHSPNGRATMQMVFQNPYASLNPRHTVRQIIGVALSAKGVPLPDQEAATVRLLERVGLRLDHLDQYPNQFSGGQRQRIAIARALATDPSFIVADEPVSALDVSVQAQILNLLEDLQSEYGLAYLLISHDLAVVHHASHRIAVMYLGKMAETGPTEELFDNPLHPYTQALLAAIPKIDTDETRKVILSGSVATAVDPPPGCRFRARCPFAEAVCAMESPEPYRAPGSPEHLVWCHKR
jgi:oligopeptide/dipeptide ABC transporter ATP-binding protein